jgi:hypothetical protein
VGTARQNADLGECLLVADSVCSPRRPRAAISRVVVVLDDRLPTTTRMGTVGHEQSLATVGFEVGC